jgi:hypothetical protein
MRQNVLIELSKNFPNKLVINRQKFDSIDKVFSYKTEILLTIDSIRSMKTFFYLTDLPDDFTENFSTDQMIRYGKVIDLIKKGASLNNDQREYESIL